MNEPNEPKTSCSLALKKQVAEAGKKAAKGQNRSFSNYVETLLVAELGLDSKKGGRK